MVHPSMRPSTSPRVPDDGFLAGVAGVPAPESGAERAVGVESLVLVVRAGVEPTRLTALLMAGGWVKDAVE